jgi:hypothetical protein
MAFKIRNFTHYMRALVLQRAILLAQEQKVKVIEHTTEHAHYHVQNQSNDYYRVELRLKEDELTFSHCECPYRGVGLCKHTGAAIIHLLEENQFQVEDIQKEEFVYEDSDVLEDHDPNTGLKDLIKEISLDKDFDLVKFLSSQEKEDLMAFIMRYLEESEDIRVVILAYLWYKNAHKNERYSNLS